MESVNLARMWEAEKRRLVDENRELSEDVIKVRIIVSKLVFWVVNLPKFAGSTGGGNRGGDQRQASDRAGTVS